WQIHLDAQAGPATDRDVYCSVQRERSERSVDPPQVVPRRRQGHSVGQDAARPRDFPHDDARVRVDAKRATITSLVGKCGDYAHDAEAWSREQHGGIERLVAVRRRPREVRAPPAKFTDGHIERERADAARPDLDYGVWTET